MELVLSTILLRPYVFAFLGCFLFISIVNFGLRTTVLFTLFTYGVALGCEWSSVHNGFPFGLYHYVEATRGRELWVLGVPFMDSLSFTFLSFASYTVALLLCAPLCRYGRQLRLLDTVCIRRSARVCLLAALFMVMVDLVVDPLSVRGDRWFLGRLFWYDPPGPFFGVPISNFVGWYLVAALSVALFQALDARLGRVQSKPLGVVAGMPFGCLLGPGLYLGIVGFGVVMLFRIGAVEIAWTAIFIYLPFIVLAAHILSRPASYGDNAAVELHLADFPYDRPFCAPPGRRAG